MRKILIGMAFAICLILGSGSKQVCAKNLEVWQKEDARAYGSDFSTARSITIGNTVNDSITENVDERIYKFTLASAGELTLNMTAYMQYHSIYIYDSEGNWIWETEYNEWNENLGYTAEKYIVDLKKGNYYLKVTGYEYDSWHGSTGTYKLRTSFISANETYPESNNSFQEASQIKTSGTVKGQIAENDRYDIYKFSVAKPGRINLKMTAYLKYNSIYLYDAAGVCIWETEYNEWNENLYYKTWNYILDLEKGNYYLKVTGYEYDSWHGSTGNYTFAMKYTDAKTNHREPNNDFASAYAIRSNVAVKGQISVNDQYDIFKFTLNKAKDVKLAMLSYLKYYNIYIYNSAGNCIWETEGNEWNGNLGYLKREHTITLDAGSYYMKVSSDRWNYYYTGTYQLCLNTRASIKDAKIASISARTYTGKAVKPGITVTYNSKKLKNGRDYTVTYKNNKNVGTATVIISGRGDYYGTKKASFKIVPKRVTLSSVKAGKRKATLTWRKQSGISGYDIMMSTRKSSGYKRIKTITKTSTVKYTRGGLRKGRTYYFKVRSFKKVSGRKIYGAYSSVKAVRVR